MKVLIIGLGRLGRSVLASFQKYENAEIQVHTRTEPQEQDFLNEKTQLVKNLAGVEQPDIIFITANAYKPHDRVASYQRRLHGDLINMRDDEQEKNEPMMREIVLGLKHLEPAPVFMTANPPELLVSLAHRELGWENIFNMQMMLDNARVARMLNVDENEIVCVGEHGRPVPAISHLGHNSQKIQEVIKNGSLAIIHKVCGELKGNPPIEEAGNTLRNLVEAIVEGKELQSVFTAFDGEVSLGKPFIIHGLDITEREIPDLSQKEQEMLRRTKERLFEKWGNWKEIKEIKFPTK